MQGGIDTGGYTKKSVGPSLATPRASKKVSVYGLSVDVFVLYIELKGCPNTRNFSSIDRI